MTIDKQKILKFIPIIQLITVFYWLKYYLTKKIPWSDFAKALLKIFAVLLFIHITRMILHFVFVNDILDNVLYYVSLYPTFLGIAAVVVADQEKHALSADED